MTFGRLAVSDFELGVDVIVLLIYCTVLYLDFARWFILDAVDSRCFVPVFACGLVIMAGNCFWYILD